MNLAKLLPLIFTCLAAQGQGMVQFRNFDAGTGMNAPVFQVRGLLEPSLRLSGTNWVAELLAGPSPSNLQTIAVTPFLSGSQAGFFDGGAQPIPGEPNGSNVFFQLRVWVAAAGSFANAQAANITGTWGQLEPLSVTLGTSNAPAVLPLYAFWVTPLSFSPNIFANYNRVNGMVEVSWLWVLQTSQDLVHWTDFTNGANLFATSHASFPLNQPSQFFRARGGP